MAISENDRSGIRASWLGMGLATIAIWGIQVWLVARADAPFGAQDSRELATQVLGARIARYLGLCPMALVLYAISSALVRVPLFGLAGAIVRRVIANANRSRRGVELATLAGAAVAWGALSVGGAWIVGLTSGGDERTARWSLEIGKVVFLSGLPCWTLVICGAAIVRSRLWRWLIEPALLLLCTLLSFGLRGEQLSAALPGIIELGLLSGNEGWHQRAVIGALLWPLVGVPLVMLTSLRPKARDARAAALLQGSA
jgi:hypothetical protein